MSRLFTLMLIVSAHAWGGVTLTETQIFMRCYAQLTQTSINPADPLLTPVKNGTKSAAVACMEIFDRAKLNSAGKVSNVSDPVALAVLSTMNRLHASWLSNREFLPTLNFGAINGTKDMFDVESPAFYFTRALLHAGTEFKYVVTATKHLRAIRSIAPTTGTYSGHTKARTIFNGQADFAMVGDLQGIQETGEMPTSYNFVNINGTAFSGSISLGKNYGGGIIGSFPYLFQTINEPTNFRADGATRMPRKWARAIFSDLMCRSMPVVRYGDASIYKNSVSTAPFRQTQGCVQCHVSMDQMAAVLRGWKYLNLDSSDTESRGIDSGLLVAPTLTTSESQWPIHADGNYSLRPTKGLFYFRDSTGSLVSLPLTSISDLGEKLADTHDLYLCAASRYYAYFTGVQIEIDDPVAEGQTSVVDKRHRAAIEALANTLETTQSARSMINALFVTPQYRNSSFQSER